ncbi:MAG: hypothetical protein SOW00_07365 [Oscillospiraceae bacterium]|nr:hypothetical protein [Oscillospiraceae bacterium]
MKLEQNIVQVQTFSYLTECLLIQLFPRLNTDDIAAKIVRDHLPEMAKNQYNSIAKTLQPEYFRHAQGVLRPMTLADVAAKLGVHESTVSRTIRGKYIQCPDGVVPLAFFFSRPAFQSNTTGDAISVENIKRRLRTLLLQEDPHKPYSDQKLANLLEKSDCSISRRTVAKYRSELGFPPATGRKQIKKLLLLDNCPAAEAFTCVHLSIK